MAPTSSSSSRVLILKRPVHAYFSNSPPQRTRVSLHSLIHKFTVSMITHSYCEHREFSNTDNKLCSRLFSSPGWGCENGLDGEKVATTLNQEHAMMPAPANAGESRYPLRRTLSMHPLFTHAELGGCLLGANRTSIYFSPPPALPSSSTIVFGLPISIRFGFECPDDSDAFFKNKFRAEDCQSGWWDFLDGKNNLKSDCCSTKSTKFLYFKQFLQSLWTSASLPLQTSTQKSKSKSKSWHFQSSNNFCRLSGLETLQTQTKTRRSKFKSKSGQHKFLNSKKIQILWTSKSLVSGMDSNSQIHSTDSTFWTHETIKDCFSKMMQPLHLTRLNFRSSFSVL